MPPQPLYDCDEINFDEPIFTLDDIRQVNPQRYEMEQLTAIVMVDRLEHGLVGYKEVTEEEFWARGHMPDFPLMPGVIQCEAAAQLANFYARKYDMLDGGFLGFGGMDQIRFRAPVYPGTRLVLMARMTKLRRRRRAEFDFQGFVEGAMAFSGSMIGVPIHQAANASRSMAGAT